MVLGLGSKKKRQAVKLEFQVLVQEIKPWKPVQSAKTPLVLHWQRGDKRSGRTNTSVPDEDGKIVFNESFKLPAKLVREPEGKGKNAGVVKFQKKTVIFSLLEATTDRQLARCVVDLGEYGDADTAVQANSPLATGKKVVTGGSPTLYFKIGLNGKKEEPRTSFSARVSFGSKAAATAKTPTVSGKPAVEPALDEETRKSLVAALMSDEDENNDSIASFTDDEDERTAESTPRTPSTSASSSRITVSESSARALPPPSPARPEPSKGTAPPSHPSPSPKRDAAKISAPTSHPPSGPIPDAQNFSGPPSHPPPSPKLDVTKVSPPPSHPPPPRPDVPKVSAPPSHPPPPAPDASKVSAPPSHPPPDRPGHFKVSPPSSLPQTPRPDASRVPPPTSIPSSARVDESKSQSTPLKRDSGDATQTAVSPADKRAETSRTTGLFTSGSRNHASSMEPTNNVPKVSNNSASVPETGSYNGKVHAKQSPEEIEEKQRAALFSTNTSPEASKGSKDGKSPVNASEPPRGALGIFSSGSQNLAGRGNRSPSTPSEGSRSPLVSKESSRGSSPSDAQAARETTNCDIAKASRSEVLAEKDRVQKSSIPLPPTSAKAAAAAAAAATGYSSRRSYRSRGNSCDFTFDSGSEDSLSPVSNGGRSPAQSPIPNAQSGTLHARSPTYSGPSRTQRALLPHGPDVSLDAKQFVSQREEKVEGIPRKEEGRRSYDRRDERSEFRKMSDMRREGNGPMRTVPQKQDEVANDDEGEAVSVLGTAKANLAKVEKRALDELRNKVANAEAKLLEANQKAQEQVKQFSQQLERLEGELRETGAMEVALYCVVAEHGNSSNKLHTPARRLTRLYMHASKHWSPERKAGTAKTCVAGLVTVAKACGTDVSRLSFWWSNVVVLRSVIVQAYDTEAPNESGSTNLAPSPSSNGNGTASWAKRASTPRKSFSRQDSKLLSPKPLSSDWQQPGTFITALEKIEGWIYTKIIESLWWQAMIPRMQKGADPSAPTSPRGLAMLSPTALSELTSKAKDDLNKLAGDVTGMFTKKPERNASVSLPELGDARQGNMSVEIWKKAMKDALCRLCPVRGAGHECGCLPMLIKTAIEGCCARLDVALFNAILRNEGDDVPTDPISDPVSDPSVLPISPGGLTFGGGSQLKNVVVTWSTFIHGLVSLKEPTFPPESDGGDGNPENPDDPEKLPKLFNLIKATGDLLMLPKDFLMDKAFRKEEAKKEAEKVASVFNVLKSTGDILQLPKDMLMDKSLRREICPMLSLHLIRRILVNFVPDEFAPDPITPSLLAALNAEAAIEKQRHGEADNESSVTMATAPPLVYAVPSAFYVWSWIGEASTEPSIWGRSSNSLLRRGYTSDEDLDVMEQLQENNASSKLDIILGSSRTASVLTSNGDHSGGIQGVRQSFQEEVGASRRFQLLKPVWGTH